MYPDHVVIPAMAQRMTTPGIIPRDPKTIGIDRTPRPICVFIMRPALPTQPTYFASLALGL